MTAQTYSPWPRWAPPKRIGVEWTRDIGGRLYAEHAPKAAG